MIRLDSLPPLDRLENRYRFRATAVAETALRVGAGKQLDITATDLPVLRDARGLPYLPGSSLKGVLRAGLSAVLAALDPKLACDPAADPCLGERRRKESIDLDEVLAESCVVCGLFGSVHLAGRVFVHDAQMTGALVDRPGHAAEVRDGVGLDRDLGTAARTEGGGVKYDVEVVPAGARFALTVTIENVDSVRLALVLDALDRLGRGELLVGGSTRRGLGRLRLVDRRLDHWDRDALRRAAEARALDIDAIRRHGLTTLVPRSTDAPESTDESTARQEIT